MYWTKSKNKKANIIILEWFNLKEIEKFNEFFEKAIKKNCVGMKKAAVLFSAGIDSSILALKVKQFVSHTTLFTIGLENSKDVLFAEKTAEQMQLNLIARIVEKKEVLERIGFLKKKFRTDDRVQFSIAVSESFAFEEISRFGFKKAFMGQGADELFCGYSKFKNILEKQGYSGVQKEIDACLKKLFKVDKKRDEKIAKLHGLKPLFPFLEKSFVEFAKSIPAEKKIFSPQDDLRKRVLREYGKSIRIPEIVLNRKKTAFQHGSGIEKIVSKNY